MYLSRLILNPRSRAVQHDLADCQAIHRTVMSVFPDALARGDARASFGVLHRLDTANGKITLLVQSSVPPDWSKLEPGYLLDTGGEVQNPACKCLDVPYHSLRTGTALVFRLRANPTRKIGTKSGPEGHRRNGRRVELRGEDALIGWLRRKGEPAGFELLSVRASPSVPNVVAMPEGKAKGRRQTGAITVASVLFEGVLRVTDIERFHQALRSGIGPGKAYGCGLLSVAAAGKGP